MNMVEHEGTYLIWLDFNGLGLCTQELEDLIVHKAKLWLDSGRFLENVEEDSSGLTWLVREVR